MHAHIGKPTSRVDGRAKVTGARSTPPSTTSATSPTASSFRRDIAKGRITRIDTSEALRVAGVFEVFTHENRPRMAGTTRTYRDEVAPPGSPFRPLYDDEIKFSGQPVALVVADNCELARYAASLVRVEYSAEAHTHRPACRAARMRADKTSPGQSRAATPTRPSPRPPCSYEAEYLIPVEHHNPMELFATTVVWDEDGKLTVYDKTQGVQNVQRYLCNVFG